MYRGFGASIFTAVILTLAAPQRFAAADEAQAAAGTAPELPPIYKNRLTNDRRRAVLEEEIKTARAEMGAWKDAAETLENAKRSVLELELKPELVQLGPKLGQLVAQRGNNAAIDLEIASMVAQLQRAVFQPIYYALRSFEAPRPDGNSRDADRHLRETERRLGDLVQQADRAQAYLHYDNGRPQLMAGVTKETLEEFIAATSAEAFAALKKEAAELIGTAAVKATAQAAAKKGEIEAKEREINQLFAMLQESEDTSALLLKYTLPITSIVVLLMMGLMVVGGSRTQSGDRSTQVMMAQHNLALDIFTVFFLVSAVLILGGAGKIDSNVLGTLIGGISGYVLGRGQRGGHGNEPAGAPRDPGAGSPQVAAPVPPVPPVPLVPPAAPKPPLP